MKHLRRTTLIMLSFLMVFTLFACGGTWVEPNLGIISTQCTEEDIEALKEEGEISPMAKTLLSTACTSISKQFAGDVRCKDGILQVKCK